MSGGIIAHEELRYRTHWVPPSDSETGTGAAAHIVGRQHNLAGAGRHRASTTYARVTVCRDSTITEFCKIVNI